MIALKARVGAVLLILSTLVALAGFGLSVAPAAARTPYDGLWSVVIITERGACDRAYRYPVRIVNGRVTYAGEGAFNIFGRVRGNGAVSVTVSRGASRASGSGRLTRSFGRGAWRGASSTDACAGVWQAERRG